MSPIPARYSEILQALRSEGIEIYEAAEQDDENYGIIRYRIGSLSCTVEFTLLFNNEFLFDLIAEVVHG